VNVATIKAYFVGSGIGSLAAAAFMIRDGKVPGKNISIYEAMNVLGGALDGAGNASEGYRLRGGRMLTSDNYECVWDLFKTIPSLENPKTSVFDETMAFSSYISRTRKRGWSTGTATVPT
jgi:oleate hydratase